MAFTPSSFASRKCLSMTETGLGLTRTKEGACARSFREVRPASAKGPGKNPVIWLLALSVMICAAAVSKEGSS